MKTRFCSLSVAIVILLSFLFSACAGQNNDSATLDQNVVDNLKTALEQYLAEPGESATAEPPETVTVPTDPPDTATPPLDPLAPDLLFGCVWDASVQTSQLFQFFPDGSGRVINLASQLTGKGIEGSFTYSIQDHSVRISRANHSEIQWEFNFAADAFQMTYHENGMDDVLTIPRVSLWDMYAMWSQALTYEIKLDQDVANNSSQTDMNIAAGTAYTCWKTAVELLYSDLLSLLSEEDQISLASEQSAWVDNLAMEMEEAGAPYAGGSIYPMIVNHYGADRLEIRFYELMLRLPDGFDHAAHDAQIESIREKYAAVEHSTNEIGTASSHTAFYLNGKLCALHEPAGISGSINAQDYYIDPYLNCRKNWYYDGTNVYFIFMVDEENGDEYRLYFHEGKLIRWINPTGQVFDYGYHWDEMQGFYEYALIQCQNYASYHPQ